MVALSSLLYTLFLHLGGRAFGPPLCRGCAPATPPYKSIAHRSCVRIPAVPLHQRGCHQPNTQSDSLNGGRDKGLVKTNNVYGLAVTKFSKRDFFWRRCLPPIIHKGAEVWAWAASVVEPGWRHHHCPCRTRLSWKTATLLRRKRFWMRSPMPRGGQAVFPVCWACL